MRDIQFTTDPVGSSPYVGQTISTGGIVTGVAYRQQTTLYYISDRTGGYWSGIMVRRTLGQDTLMSMGDSVRFLGTVDESSGQYTGQTRLTVASEASYSRFPSIATVPPLFVGADSVGEATEGVLVELRNVTVTEVAHSESFRIADSTGTMIVERSWPYSYAPFAEETMSFIRGIVSYRNGQFTLNPRADSDFGPTGNYPPFISNVRNFPTVPSAVQTDTVVATVFDVDGVDSVSVYYRFGESGDFARQAMRDDGTHGDAAAGDGIWTGVIPAGPQRVTAYYYIRAVDVMAAASVSPAGAPETTYSYFIRSATFSIFDIQYRAGNPTGESSPYDGVRVTVTGIVTGTQFGDNRRDFFLSDPGGGLWSGVLVFSPSLTPALGDCVLVSGTVSEYYGLTELAGSPQVTVLGRGSVPEPLEVRIGQLPDSAEAYEGTLAIIGPCVVANVNSWFSYRQFTVRDATGDGVILGDFPIDFVPAVGDSFRSIVGCVSYHSSPGWMVAPRTDADIDYVDRRPPQLVSASAVAERYITVRFNEALSDSGVADLGNYEIVDLSDPLFPQLHIESASLFSDRRTLHIVTLQELQAGHAYRLTIDGVRDLAGNPLSNISADFSGYEPGVYTSIRSIYDNFAEFNGDTVVFRGVVNFVQDVTTSSGSRRISAFMQDESGRGFSLSQSGAASTYPGIRRGNFITIRGVVNEFGGTIQLGGFNAASVTVLAENVPLTAPIIVRTGDYRTQRAIIRTSQPGSYGAGTWVETTGVIYRVDENVGGGTNIAIDDGTGNLTIRIWDSMNLDTVYLQGRPYLLRDLVGKSVTIAGPSSTYNGDFQMLAGYTEDFTSRTLDIEPSEKAWIKMELRPFAPDLGQTLKIEYNAPALSQVRLRVFDLRGRLVRTLRDKGAGGPEMIEWDGRTDLRDLVPIGTYILHLETVQNGAREQIVKPVVVGTKL